MRLGLLDGAGQSIAEQTQTHGASRRDVPRWPGAALLVEDPMGGDLGSVVTPPTYETKAS